MTASRVGRGIGLCGLGLLVACGEDDPPPLAQTPPMGWSSWNAFGCAIDEDLIKAQADALVATGMRDLGYLHVNIDDCWMAPERTDSLELQADPTRFPGGIGALADYVHARGLKLGIYASPGLWTCNYLPGSFDRDDIDAETFAAWGVDYLKYDACSAVETDVGPAMLRMREALDRTGRPIVFSVNPSGAAWDRPWSDVAHLWRTTPDIKPVWSAACTWWCGVMDIADINEPLADRARPGAWNDPDMLEVGVSHELGTLATGEARVHMTLWAIMAAPLIAGADLRALTPDAAALYTNAELIAIDQDRLGIQGRRIRDDGDAELWSRPLADGRRAVALVNRSPVPLAISVAWTELGLAGPAVVRDVWASADRGSHASAFGAEVPARDVVLLTVGSAD
jgi:alpha-galactosidase